MIARWSGGGNGAGGFLTMYKRDVLCGSPECEKLAAYKIAAPWSYGKFAELKSYGLACEDHFGAAFRDARRRWSLHLTSPEETIGEVGLYRFEAGRHDRQLERLDSLEKDIR
jgi:hypothetical protein